MSETTQVRRFWIFVAVIGVGQLAWFAQAAIEIVNQWVQS